MLQNFDRFKEFLRSYGFDNIKEHQQYISFGRDDVSSAKSIVVYKRNADRIVMHDYAHNLHCGISEYLNQEKGVDPEEVFVEMQRYLGLSSLTTEKTLQLGDLKADFIPEPDKDEILEDPDPIDEKLLDVYPRMVNQRFWRDGISYCTQMKYGLRYDMENGLIIIPIRREDGKLVGIKARLNREVQHGELKYFYVENCQISKTLFGYSMNKDFLIEKKQILLFEAEKSVMQADGFNVRNCLALGSSTISQYQCELLNRLQPQSVVVMTDKGLSETYVERICKEINRFCPEVQIYVWHAPEDFPDKASPTDLGEEAFWRTLERNIALWELKSP